MNLVWEAKYEKEENLMHLNGIELRELYSSSSTPANMKHLIAKIAASKLVVLEDATVNPSIHHAYASLRVVSDYNSQVQKDEDKIQVDYKQVHNYAQDVSSKIASLHKESNELPLAQTFALKSALNMMLISAQNLNKKYKEDEDYKNLEVINKELNEGIIDDMKDPAKNASEEAIKQYIMADASGLLNDVKIDENVKQQFLNFIANQTGWKEATKESIEAADNKLNSNISSVDVYTEKDGQVVLNPLFAGCVELANSLQYDLPEGTDKETANKYKMLYNEQLMANALQRATQDVLRDPNLLGNTNNKEAIEAKFRGLIADNFSRSVIVAGLATSPNTTDGITIDKDTGRVSYDNSDVLAGEIEEITKGTRKISPLAVNLDTHQLGIETSRTEAVLNLKKVDKTKVPFFNKVKTIAQNVYNRILKEGGWKKIAVNGLMFGGAAIAMASPTTAVIATGAAVYAGWTAATAWAAPVWDKLSAEMRERNITGFKNKLAYRLKNWKRAKQEKYAEPDFKKRAAWRTVEGVTIGGVTAALGLGGATGWAKTLIRQGTMVAGKATSLTKSWLKKKSAAEKMAEQYSVANYQTLQTAEGYLKQDKVALTAVVGGALLGDAVKLHAEGAIDTSSINEQLSELSSKIKEAVISDTDVTVENVTPEAEVVATPESEVVTTPEVEVVTTSEVETSKNIDINDLDNDHKKMFLNSHKKWENTDINKYIGRFEKEGYHVSGDFKGAEKGIVQEFYKAIQNGQVESCPEGMSPVEYVDKLTRLMQLAPGEQKKGIELMLRDLLCDEYVPSAADKQTIAEALNTIRYEKGTSQCIIYDEFGNPCVKSMPNFGNYFGQRKVAEVQLETGEVVKLPVRNANVTVALGAEVDCGAGIGKISSVYVVNQVDCGCDETPEPPVVEPELEPDPKPIIEEKIIPTIKEETAEGRNLFISGEKDVVEPKEEVSVDMKDPYARGTAIKSGKKSYYDVDVETVNGEAKRFSNGVLHVWDKDGNVVTENGYEDIRVKRIEVELHAPSDVTQVVNKLPDVPTNVVKGEDGSITYLYEFDNGKNVSVVIDAPKDGETERVGHFYVGNDEVVIDKKSADALMGKMSEKTNMHFTSTDGAEQSVMERVELSKRLQEKAENYYTKRAEAMENPVAPEENADFLTRKTSSQPVELTSDQKAKIMSNNTEVNCIGIKDGRAILEVQGVKGVNRIAVAAPTHVDYNLSEHQPVATVGENGQYSVAITTADDKQMVVDIANGKATTLLDGKPVVLDSSSSETTQNMVKMALRQKNVNMNIDLHTDFTEKVVKAVEKATVNGGQTKTIAPVVTQSTGR